MKSSWNDMNKKEKAIFIVYCIISVIGAIAAVIDLTGKWEHADIFWMVSVSVLLVIDCAQNWNKNRKLAIIEVIGGIIMLVSSIGNKLIK